MEQTGLHRNSLTHATTQLEEAILIRKQRGRSDRGEFGGNAYLLLDPDTGDPLIHHRNNICYKNNIPYFTVPRSIVTERSAPWSLQSLTSSELKTYSSLLFSANKERHNSFTISSNVLRKLSGISANATFKNALERLEELGLVQSTSSQDSKVTNATICDPLTGEPVPEEALDPIDDPSNYFTLNERGRSKRPNFNSPLAQHQLEELLQLILPKGSIVRPAGGAEVVVNCPFHSDSTPSCSINGQKLVWQCFGCNQTGRLLNFVERVSGSRAETYKKFAQATGNSLEYREPDKNATIYRYKDKYGHELKQVLRYPNKTFRQRRWSGGDWIWNTKGVRPILYNEFFLDWAQTVILVEGEKDADSVNIALNGSRDKLHGASVVAVTSGGSDSWRDSLGEYLLWRRVIVLPDADEAGLVYRDRILESLQTREIEHRVVTFEADGVKDVSEWLEAGRTPDKLRDRLGRDWVEAENEVVLTTEREGV